MMTRSEWRRAGLELCRIVTGGMWRLGDWYLFGRREYGPGWCKQVVTAPAWRGVEYPSLQVYASIAKRFPPLIRIKHASPALHQLAAPLTDDQALPLLRRAVRENWNTNRMRVEARRIRLFQPLVGGDVFDDIADIIAQRRFYRGILADPPWQWDTAGGRAGSTTSYYPVMPLEELYALRVAEVSEPDAFLFLWCPPALFISSGVPVMQAWGYDYKTNVTWDKLGNFGRGAYLRMDHEHLLVGVRPGTPTHFLDNSISSMLRVKSTRNNSEKPPETHRIVERAVAGPYLELFARQHMEGWDCYGNQLKPLASASGKPHLLAAA